MRHINGDGGTACIGRADRLGGDGGGGCIGRAEHPGVGSVGSTDHVIDNGAGSGGIDGGQEF